MQLSDASNFVPHCDHTKGPYSPMITDIVPFPYEYPHPLSIDQENGYQRPGGHIKYRIYCECGASCSDRFSWGDNERHTFVLRCDSSSFKMITSKDRHMLTVKLHILDSLGCGTEVDRMGFLIEGKEWTPCALSV